MIRLKQNFRKTTVVHIWVKMAPISGAAQQWHFVLIKSHCFYIGKHKIKRDLLLFVLDIFPHFAKPVVLKV